MREEQIRKNLIYNELLIDSELHYYKKIQYLIVSLRLIET